jgi:hypothetical protein
VDQQGQWINSREINWFQWKNGELDIKKGQNFFMQFVIIDSWPANISSSQGNFQTGQK